MLLIPMDFFDFIPFFRWVRFSTQPLESERQQFFEQFLKVITDFATRIFFYPIGVRVRVTLLHGKR